MKRQPFALVVVCAILLTACGASVSASPTATATSVPPTSTFTPTLTFTPEPTFTPTATPTPRLPVAPGTQMPSSGSALSADNIDQVVELARWGKGVITDAAYSPNGKLIAIATTLGVSVYEADTLTEKTNFATNASVNGLVFSPDGETIATGLADNTVKLWKVSDGGLFRSLDDHTDKSNQKDAEKTDVKSVAFSQDGSLLAGGFTDGTVSLWQVSDGSLVNTFNNSAQDVVVSVFFSPDGQFLFFASRDGKIRMVSVVDGKSIRAFTVGRDISDSSISADGKILAAYDPIDGQSLILLDVESSVKLQTINVTQDLFDDFHLALSPDGQFVVVGLNDYSAKIWSVSSGALQSTLEDLQPKEGRYYFSSFAVAFSPDSQSILMAGSNVIGIWDVKKGALLNSAKIKSEPTYSIALSPDEQTLASVEGTNVYLWQIADGNSVSPKDSIQSNGHIKFSSDGNTILTSLFDNSARIWPLSDQGVRRSLEMEKKEYISAVAFSPDGEIVALGTGDPGKVELRRVADGSLVQTLGFNSNYYYLYMMAFSLNGEFIAVANYDQIILFRVADGKIVKYLKGGIDLAISPDSTFLAAGGKDKIVTVWKIPGGETLHTLKDFPAQVNSVAFSPDGTLLVSGGDDGTIEVFLASDGTLLMGWKGHSLGVTDLLFSSDGKLLISASYDGTIRIWGVKP